MFIGAPYAFDASRRKLDFLPVWSGRSLSALVFTPDGRSGEVGFSATTDSMRKNVTSIPSAMSHLQLFSRKTTENQRVKPHEDTENRNRQ
jgi:hypothetical protein